VLALGGLEGGLPISAQDDLCSQRFEVCFQQLEDLWVVIGDQDFGHVASITPRRSCSRRARAAEPLVGNLGRQYTATLRFRHPDRQRLMERSDLPGASKGVLDARSVAQQ